MGEYFEIENYTLLLLAGGLIALLAATVPVLTRKKYVTAPILYVGIGALSYLLSTQYGFDPMKNLEVIERITEFVLLVALTNAGLKIKEPFAWKTWRYSFRLLSVAMLLTIAAGAFISWKIAGLAPAGALLFGALIAPTDPVLASELQTSEPSKKDTSTIKLGLTTEAGVNDGLAFPFVYFAIYAATKGLDFQDWAAGWFLHDFIIKIAIAVVIGLAVGALLCKLIFTLGNKDKISKISRGIISLAIMLLPYAITEIIGGYGFLAVFVAACIFSHREEHAEHMDDLHDFNEELESIVVAIIFIMTGFFIAYHYEILYKLQILSIALIMVFVVRPVAGYLSLLGTNLIPFQKFTLSFYGIRGVGSLYYLTYALTAAPFADAEKLLEITIVTIFISMLVHGFTARTIQKKIKQYHDAKQ